MAVSHWLGIGGIILSFMAGCGNDPGGYPASLKHLRPLIPAGAPQATTAQETGVVPQDGTLLRMRLDADGRSALMARMAERGPTQTFLTADPISFTLNGGRLVETRGLSFDLMSAEPGPPLASLRSGDVYLRRWQVIGADDVIRDIRLSCTAGVTTVKNARHIAERCEGEGFDVLNRFVMNSPQTLAWSRQWIGPRAGYAVVQQPEN